MINQEFPITELAFIFYAGIKTSGIFVGYIAHLCINLPCAQLSTAVRADTDVSEFEIESAWQQDEMDQDVNTQKK